MLLSSTSRLGLQFTFSLLVLVIKQITTTVITCMFIITIIGACVFTIVDGEENTDTDENKKQD